MTLLFKHMIQNLSFDGLTPSTLPLGLWGFPEYGIFIRMNGKATLCHNIWKWELNYIKMKSSLLWAIMSKSSTRNPYILSCLPLCHAEEIYGAVGIFFTHKTKLGQDNSLRMVRWIRWHFPTDTGFKIRAPLVWCRAHYLSNLTGSPYCTLISFLP